MLGGFDLSPFGDFAETFDLGRYRPVPENWSIAVSDVVNSTNAIKNGCYKDVNLAGAATIAGILNASARDDLPFAFGGDGGIVLVPQEFEIQAVEALRATRRMCGRVLSLDLRVSLIPVKEITKRGGEVLVAAHDLGSGKILAMLAGGGIALAERLCKSEEGREFLLAESDAEPDLTGLSCRWEPIAPANGVVVALVVQARDESALAPIYRDLHARIAAVTGGGTSPVQRGPLTVRWPPSGLAREAEIQGRKGRLRRKARILFETAASLFSLATGRVVGGFHARKYHSSLPGHSDYRKYSDSLRMLIDCTPTQAADLRDLLDKEWQRGTIDYGMHDGAAALMTCFVKNTEDGGHIHFIDGADGGYALAASDMKKRMGG